jgi:Ca2+-binding RTX toxin-like protein
MGLILGTSGDDVLVGTPTEDTLSGLAGNDSLSGGAGLDVLKGGDGDDILDGGIGGERTPGLMYGGSGDPSTEININGGDIADYRSVVSGVTIDLRLTGPQNTGQGLDTLIGIEDLWSGAGADRLTGDDGANQILAGDGDDQLFGEGGDDILVGYLGVDTLHGGAGNDILRGGSIVLGFNAAGGGDYLYGDAGDDQLVGSASADWLDGGDGGDTLVGYAGADHYLGGAGADQISVDFGDIEADGGEGDDQISVEGLPDGEQQHLAIVTGGAGDDLFRFSDDLSTLSSALTLDGGAGIDSLSLEFSLYFEGSVVLDLSAPADAPGLHLVGVEIISVVNSAFDATGSASGETFIGGAANDILRGGGGDDVLSGGLGGDLLDGGAGADYASYAGAAAGVTVFLGGPYLNAGEAVGDSYVSIEGVVGSAYADLIGGTNAADALRGEAGNDWLIGAAGGDWLDGGAGNDVLEGGAGADVMAAGAGDDVASYRQATAGVTASFSTSSSNAGEAAGDVYFDVENLWGSDFADTLGGNDASGQVYGFGGADTLNGLGGDDALYGGDGADAISGGTGADTFFFLQSSEGGDTITDFVSGQDRVFFSEYWFGLPIAPAGSISASRFVSGDHPAAAGPGASFLFDTASHQLLFDPDGSGAQAAILMATFSNGVNLTAGDIWAA